MRRYTSLQSSVLLKEFNLSSVSYLRKIIQRSVGICKSAKRMLNCNSISKYTILMFIEMYQQKREEFTGVELTGVDPDDNPYKGIKCFMIVGLKENVPFVVKDIPETGVTETRWNLRLQCDHLESRYCHYRQMSGANLLVSLREIKLFEK